MVPLALAARRTFFVREPSPVGRNRKIVHGRPLDDVVFSVCDTVPVLALNTRTAPSPHPAARYLEENGCPAKTHRKARADAHFPSGEKRTEKTSAARPDIVMLGLSFRLLRGPSLAGANDASTLPQVAIACCPPREAAPFSNRANRMANRAAILARARRRSSPPKGAASHHAT